MFCTAVSPTMTKTMLTSTVIWKDFIRALCTAMSSFIVGWQGVALVGLRVSEKFFQQHLTGYGLW